MSLNFTVPRMINLQTWTAMLQEQEWSQQNGVVRTNNDQSAASSHCYFIQFLLLFNITAHILRPFLIVWGCGQHTVTFSKSASEEVGDRGLMGLREGELPTLGTYSGSGTYRTCKHNPGLNWQRRRLCAKHTCMNRRQQKIMSLTYIRTQPNHVFLIVWTDILTLLTRTDRHRESHMTATASEWAGPAGVHAVRTVNEETHCFITAPSVEQRDDQEGDGKLTSLAITFNCFLAIS